MEISFFKPNKVYIFALAFENQVRSGSSAGRAFHF